MAVKGNHMALIGKMFFTVRRKSSGVVKPAEATKNEQHMGLLKTVFRLIFDSESQEPVRQLPDGSSEAKRIAGNVTTIQAFHALEKKFENVETQLFERTFRSESEYEEWCHEHNVLQQAIAIAGSKTYQWQFVPSLELSAPKRLLVHAYKVYSSRAEYEAMRKTLDAEHWEWRRMDGYSEKYNPEPYFEALIKFRTIVESGEPQEVMVDKINKLVRRNSALKERFFDEQSQLNPGDQWFAQNLSFDGLPLAYQLYSEGYTTPEKCLEIDAEEFLSRKGVGPKRLEQLKEFQARVRNESRNP